MNKLVCIVLLTLLATGLAWADDTRAPLSTDTKAVGKINPRSTVVAFSQSTRDEDEPAPSYTWGISPISLTTTFYDYMPAGYTSLPIHVQPQQVNPPSGYQGAAGGISFAYHAQATLNGERRVYYAYITPDGNVDYNQTVSSAVMREGFASSVIDPMTGNTIFAWHADEDGDEMFQIYISVDNFNVVGQGGLIGSRFIVYDNQNNPPAAVLEGDNYTWPNLYVGTSPLGDNYRRLYMVAKNGTAHYVDGDGDELPSENVLIGYLDYTAADIASTLDPSNNPSLQWNFRHIELLDNWHEGNPAWYRPYIATQVQDNVVILMGRKHGLADDGWDEDDEDLFLLYNDNYGEGDFQDIYGQSEMEFDPSHAEPVYPDGDQVLDAYDLIMQPYYETHHNVLIGKDGKFWMPMNMWLTGTSNDDDSSIYFPYLGAIKLINYDPATSHWHKQDLYPFANHVQQGDEYTLVPWDADGDGELDVNDEDQYTLKSYFPMWWYVPETDDGGGFEDNNQKMCQNRETGAMATVWQDCTNARYHHEDGEEEYLDWANTPVINISVSNNMGLTWSYPIQISSNSDETLSGMIPEYVYPAEEMTFLGSTGSGINQIDHYRIYLFFLDDNSYGSSHRDFGADDGGTLMFGAIDIDVPVGTDDGTQAPSVVSNQLTQNYPNPFNPTTSIKFNLANSQNISLDIYNLKGQKVKTLANGHYGQGEHSVVWNGTDNNGTSVASGMYMYKLQTPQGATCKKMLLLK